jgi:hypothetical protein
MSQAQIKKIIAERKIKVSQDEIRQLSRNFQKMRPLYEKNGKLTESQIKIILINMLEEQIDNKQGETEKNEQADIVELLGPLHQKFIYSMLNQMDNESPLAKLRTWISDLVKLYQVVYEETLIHPESEVTIVSQEMTEVPEGVANEWNSLHLQVMKASANVNDCLIHTFLTCVSPVFRTLLRKIDSVKKPGERRLGDLIAGMFRRQILPMLLAELRDVTSLSVSVTFRLINDVDGEGLLSDELFGPLSRLFKIIIFVRDRDNLVENGVVGANGWIGTNTTIRTDSFIIIFNPGQSHYEPVRDSTTNTYIFNYSLIEPRFRNGPPLQNARRSLMEKRLINSETELDAIKNKLNSLQRLLQDNSSVKPVLRRNIARLQEEQLIVDQVIREMKKNLRGGGGLTRKKRTTLRQ